MQHQKRLTFGLTLACSRIFCLFSYFCIFLFQVRCGKCVLALFSSLGSWKRKNDITLVLTYKVADVEYYEKYYDNIIIPENVYGAHPKSAITLKNRWMVEQSELVIVYI